MLSQILFPCFSCALAPSLWSSISYARLTLHGFPSHVLFARSRFLLRPCTSCTRPTLATMDFLSHVLVPRFSLLLWPSTFCARPTLAISFFYLFFLLASPRAPVRYYCLPFFVFDSPSSPCALLVLPWLSSQRLSRSS